MDARTGDESFGVQGTPHKSLWGVHAGQIEVHGDIVGPILEEFEAHE